MLQDYEIKRKHQKLNKSCHILNSSLCLSSSSAFYVIHRAGRRKRRQFVSASRPFKYTGRSAIKQEIQLQIEPLIEKAVDNSQSKEELGDNLAALEAQFLKSPHRLQMDRSITLERKEALFPAKRSGLCHPSTSRLRCLYY